MAPTITAAHAANDKAVLRVKVACHNLERHLPPTDDTEQDETVASEAPSIRPGQRKTSVVECAECAEEIKKLPAGDRAGHLCTHQQGGGGGGGGGGGDVDVDDASDTGSDDVRPGGSRARGGKKRQADEGVLREYVEKMDEKMDAFVQAAAVLCSVVEKADIDMHEAHLLEWSTYCEGLKDRARDVIALLVIARHKNADRMFAIQLARDQVAADTDTGKGGAVNAPPPAVTPASATTAVSVVVTPSAGS